MAYLVCVRGGGGEGKVLEVMEVGCSLGGGRLQGGCGDSWVRSPEGDVECMISITCRVEGETRAVPGHDKQELFHSELECVNP